MLLIETICAFLINNLNDGPKDAYINFHKCVDNFKM